MTENERIQAIQAMESHLAMNRQERRAAGIRIPRKQIEAIRDELDPYREQGAPDSYNPPRTAVAI